MSTSERASDNTTPKTREYNIIIYYVHNPLNHLDRLIY